MSNESLGNNSDSNPESTEKAKSSFLDVFAKIAGHKHENKFADAPTIENNMPPVNLEHMKAGEDLKQTIANQVGHLASGGEVSIDAIQSQEASLGSTPAESITAQDAKDMDWLKQTGVTGGDVNNAIQEARPPDQR